jgi:hypothetical protein
MVLLQKLLRLLRQRNEVSPVNLRLRSATGFMRCSRQISLAQPFTAGLATDVKCEASLMGLSLTVANGPRRNRLGQEKDFCVREPNGVAQKVTELRSCVQSSGPRRVCEPWVKEIIVFREPRSGD